MIPLENTQLELRSAYQLLDKNSKDDNTDGIFHAIWKLKLPNKVAFFVWRLMRDRLPTKLNLTRRNIDINDTLCPFCTEKEEDAGHLFFSCHQIRQIWWESLSWINMVGPFSQHPRQNFMQHSFYNTHLGIKSQRWLIWGVALTWSIWNHRNRIVFSNDSPNTSKIMDDAIFLCWSWLRNLEKGFDNPFHQWSSHIREGFCN